MKLISKYLENPNRNFDDWSRKFAEKVGLSIEEFKRHPSYNDYKLSFEYPGNMDVYYKNLENPKWILKSKEYNIDNYKRRINIATLTGDALRALTSNLKESHERDIQLAKDIYKANNAYQEERKQKRIEDFYPYKLYMKTVPTALAAYSLGLSAKELLGHPLTSVLRFSLTGADATGSILDFILAGAGIHDQNFKATGINSAQGVVGGIGVLGASDYLQGLGNKGRIADKVLDFVNAGSNIWEIGNNIFF